MGSRADSLAERFQRASGAVVSFVQGLSGRETVDMLRGQGGEVANTIGGLSDRELERVHLFWGEWVQTGEFIER